MRSLICMEPGRLEYREDPLPIRKAGELLLQVRHVGICGTDLHAFAGNQPYFSYPRILGHELSCRVAEADRGSGWQAGEWVTLMPYFYCGNCVACRMGKTNCCINLQVFGVHMDGGMREYIVVPEWAVMKGGGLEGELLALVEPLAIGAHGIKRAGVREGEWVMVVGAGPIGLGTMAFAKLAGARVIAVDKSIERLSLAVSFAGVDAVIDANGNNILEKVRENTGGDMPAVVIDATGSLGAINDAFRFISHGGRYVLIGLQKGDIQFSHPEFHKREATLMSSRNAVHADFEEVMLCLGEKKIDAGQMITHRISFDGLGGRFGGLAGSSQGLVKAMVGI